jgi:hypothetical protein
MGRDVATNPALHLEEDGRVNTKDQNRKDPPILHTQLTIDNFQMKGAAPDLSAATYQIHDETHTIGNALRWMLMKKCAIFIHLTKA